MSPNLLVLCAPLITSGAPADPVRVVPVRVVVAAPQGLTVFRPQHGAGYAPFARLRVPEELEEDVLHGPGIRVNGPRELDPRGEDDLVEVVIQRTLEGVNVVLERSGPQLCVWSTRERRAGTELLFDDDLSEPLEFGRAASMTLWVEWCGPAPAFATLALRTLESDMRIDRVLFHSFSSLVVALGGEGQSPRVPPDDDQGTFLVAQDLYELGYDVLMSDEDAVRADGSGSVYDEVVNAIQHRSVSKLAIFGYSHGAGSTHDLCDRLDALRGGIGTFEIAFTSYVDGIENDSDIDLDKERRHPPASAFHVNQYQRGSIFDLFLDGGPVPDSVPPPTGLDVQTRLFGLFATHFVVDDYEEVRDFILSNLQARMSR